MHQLKQTARIGAVILAVCALGCAGMTPEARQILQQPLSCEEAPEQVQALQESRPGGFKRFAHFIQGIGPPMVVLSLLRDAFIGKPYRSIYLDHWRVSFGSYSRKTDARLEELRACTE
jgi:hypothetical protein